MQRFSLQKYSRKTGTDSLDINIYPPSSGEREKLNLRNLVANEIMEDK
jgi:hypothetical protein